MAFYVPVVGYVVAEGTGPKAAYEEGKKNRNNINKVRAVAEWMCLRKNEILSHPKTIGTPMLFTERSDNISIIFDNDPWSAREIFAEIQYSANDFAVVVPSWENFLSPKWSELIHRACHRHKPMPQIIDASRLLISWEGYMRRNAERGRELPNPAEMIVHNAMRVEHRLQSFRESGGYLATRAVPDAWL